MNFVNSDGSLESDDKVHKSSVTFARLLKIIGKYRSPLCLGILMILLGTVCTLLEPRIFAYAIDEAIVPKRIDRLHTVGVIFVVVTCLRVIAATQQSYFFEMLGQKVTHDLRVRLFSHLQQLPVEVFDKVPAGRLLTRVTNDIASLNEMFSAGFVSMICNILLVAGILVGLMVLDFRLGLIATSTFPFLVGAAVYFSKRLKVAYRESRNSLSAVNAFLAENLLGMKIVHLFNRQKLHLKRFDQLNGKYAEAQTQSIRIFAFFQPTITVAAGISVGLIIGFGGKEALQGTLKVGALVAFFSYILALFQPIREIADKWNIFLSGISSAERVFSLLDWKGEFEGEGVHQAALPIEDLRGTIRFENVWFAYEKENWILKDFTLEIKQGERIGVVGHTGAGKTTLISLLMRFYDPQKGRILLDGKDLKEYDKRSLRASIGIVQQDVFLFLGSFEENITFWKNISREHLAQSLSALKLNESWHQALQERGSNFSMGERQIIAFARALIAKPKIWILDEATANMDSTSEEMLQNALEIASADRTTLLVAHRLSTIRTADRIIVLNKGHLIEMGSHEVLMKKEGLYARLYRFQRSKEPTFSLGPEREAVAPD